jgi:hypothetical protein
MDLFYLLIILFSCVQSACTKFYNRYSSDVLVFNKLKSFSALVVFALILIGGCDFNLTTVVYGAIYGIFLSISMYAGCAALCMGKRQVCCRNLRRPYGFGRFGHY